MSNATVSSAPLTGTLETIPIDNAEDPEKKTDVQIDDVKAQSSEVYQEDEEFEWREVFRGRQSVDAMSNVKHTNLILPMYFTAFRDPQVWMTAFSYMGIIVSLYSFSLFL